MMCRRSMATLVSVLSLVIRIPELSAVVLSYWRTGDLLFIVD